MELVFTADWLIIKPNQHLIQPFKQNLPQLKKKPHPFSACVQLSSFINPYMTWTCTPRTSIFAAEGYIIHSVRLPLPFRMILAGSSTLWCSCSELLSPAYSFWMRACCHLPPDPHKHSSLKYAIVALEWCVKTGDLRKMRDCRVFDQVWSLLKTLAAHRDMRAGLQK